MSDKKITIGTITAAALSLGVTGASAADRAGVAERVQNDAFQSTVGIGFPVAQHDEVFQNAKVYTKEYGSMEVLLDDGTSLTVAPNSSVTIDEYVYAGRQSTGSLSLSLAKGAVRFVSGRMTSDSYKVTTQVATIGVRGTTFWLNERPDGNLEVWTLDGTVTAAPVNSTQTFTFDAPAYALCSDASCEQGDVPPVPATYPLDPTDPGNEDGLGDDEGGESGFD